MTSFDYNKLIPLVAEISEPFYSKGSVILAELYYRFTGSIYGCDMIGYEIDKPIFRRPRNISKYWKIGPVGGGTTNWGVDEPGCLYAVIKFIDNNYKLREEKFLIAENINDRKTLQSKIQEAYFNFTIHKAERSFTKTILAKIGTMFGETMWAEIAKALGAIEIPSKVYRTLKTYFNNVKNGVLEWTRYTDFWTYAFLHELKTEEGKYTLPFKIQNSAIIDLPFIIKLGNKKQRLIDELTKARKEDIQKGSIKWENIRITVKAKNARLSRKGTSIVAEADEIIVKSWVSDSTIVV